MATIQSEDEEMSATSEAKQLPQMHSMIHNYSHNTKHIVLESPIDHSHSSNRTDFGLRWIITITALDSKSITLTEQRLFELHH
jgi:hypothetical protein